MEATEHILPPRLEDAGLEDCALSPDSIKEAFLKAATAVLHGDEDEEDKPHGGCGGEKGGGAVEEVGGDEVVMVGGKEEKKKKKDKVIDGGVEVGDGDEAACLDGLGGLEIGDKNKKKKKKKKDEGPILVGGYA